MHDFKISTMMFSSNQLFDVTCKLEHLPFVIDFAVKLDGKLEMFTRSDGRVKPAYKVDERGRYCLGTGSMAPCSNDWNHGHPCSEEWTDYPFDYDPGIIGNIVAQWVRNQPAPAPSGTDGTERLGVRVRCKTSLPSDPTNRDGGLGNHWPCILVFEPYHLGYDK